jgi:hypothetical protein
MAQRRGVRRVAPLFECGAGRSQLLPTAPGAVNQDDVFGFGHETKDDSQGARQCPIRVKLFVGERQAVDAPPRRCRSPYRLHDETIDSELRLLAACASASDSSSAARFPVGSSPPNREQRSRISMHLQQRTGSG